MDTTRKISIPPGYKIKDICGSTITLEKIPDPFPGTWEACARKMRDNLEYITPASNISNAIYTPIMAHKENRNLVPTGYGAKVLALEELLLCREAYWDGWKPNWENGTIKYCIGVHPHREECYKLCATNAQYILAFPTEEMRNHFLQSFKDLILKAGELL